MTRITCRTPSTGKPIRVVYQSIPTNYTTVAEAPDFSVPDTSVKYADRDPVDTTRAIRPGEIYFMTPISAKNKDAVTRWIEFQLLTEEGLTIGLGRTYVPAGDTFFVPIQGRSLLKRIPTATYGDRLQVAAETAGAFDIWGAAEEKLSSEHIGVE